MQLRSCSVCWKGAACSKACHRVGLYSANLGLAQVSMAVLHISTGHREGYAFKTGPRGVGYYKDAPAAVGEQPRAPPPPVAVNPSRRKVATSASPDSDGEGAGGDNDGDDGNPLMQPVEGPLPNKQPLPDLRCRDCCAYSNA